MFDRKINARLRQWKERKPKKPLLLRGARQVGKSTIVNQFGKKYSSFISLNLEKKSDAAFFENESDDISEIFSKIVLDRNIPFLEDDTLLFIDEIQEVPNAIKQLRYFYEDVPRLDVIAAGSLLEFAIGDVSSFPVGRIEYMNLYPMDFEEFLGALGEEMLLEYYRQIPVLPIAHNKLLQLFNTYIQVGGMPEVVSAYISGGKKIESLGRVYETIWDTYVRDIEKYGSNPSERKILRHIVHTSPFVRDRISFNGFGNSNYRSREVGEAFRKLDKVGLIRLVYPTSDTDLPAQLKFKRKPKLQFLDTGLLNYAAGIQSSMIGVSDMNSLYKGYITNHMVVQELIATNNDWRNLPPFWTRENANANAEVDIVISHKNKLVPIEVKSGKKGRLRSLHEYMLSLIHI